MIKKAFTEHPASVGETYFEHMGMAFGFGSKMVVAGLACLMHGLFPFAFTTTGKDCIKKLHTSMVTHRDRRIPVDNDMPAMQRNAKAISAAE